MAWVDYRKAFDSTSHQLILMLLEWLGAENNLVRCIGDLVPLWRTRFTITSGDVQIISRVVQFRRGVFQGDSLSPLLFNISRMPLSVALRAVEGYKAGRPGDRRHEISHLYYMDDLKLFASGERQLKLQLDIVAKYSEAVGMEFGLDKCAAVHIKRGRVDVGGEDVQLVDGNVIQHLDIEGSYCYLGLNQRSIVDEVQVKEALRSEYKRRLRRVWRSELSGKNKVSATNMFAVPVLLYSFGVVKWSRSELKQLDRDTRKLMNIHRSLHPRSSSPRLYFPRECGGRGLLRVESLHDRLVLGVACDVVNSTDPLMDFVHEYELRGVQAFLYKAADGAAEALGLEFRRGRGQVMPANSLVGMSKSRRKVAIRSAEQAILYQQHADRPMHGRFFCLIEVQSSSAQLTFSFLKSAGLMSETEGFICACQDGVINTLVYRSRIMGLQVPDTRCRACKQAPETLTHLLSACPTYAVSAYIHRHNAALRVLYYHLRHSYGVDGTPVLPYAPGEIESVVVNESCKIYWNFSRSY
uniref:Reverse transcriptase domain-containing protein n=1 Tax=Bracon brevicornis TaxID=1563983 RepID=A0A6V7LE95_9HYME